MTFQDIVVFGRENDASDIHFTVGCEPIFRINGDLVRMEGFENFLVTNRLVLSILDAAQEEKLRAGEDLDFVFELSTGERQRVNTFRAMGKLACSCRLLNNTLLTLEELNLPPIIKDLSKKRNGLILVTGATGSGKTTTLSLLVDFINRSRACHIITIEDPVEYRHQSKLATIHQREVGRDVKSFDYALRSSLREDPDVILVGELRDYETMQLAVTAAATGHLVLGTLHTRGAAHTVSRIVDACPKEIQHQMMIQLSQAVECIISQALLPREDGRGRIAALEIMLGTDAVRNIIRSEKTHQLESTMQQSKAHGMCILDDEILGHYRKGLITKNTALDYANDRPTMASKI